jgi:photosystem II stability/assembly factor-like uncharacterized protein
MKAVFTILAATIVIAGASACGSSAKPVALSAASSWRVQFQASTDSSLMGLAFVDTQHGWVVGWDGVSVTHDGGITWTSQPLPSRAVGGVSHITAVDAMHVWATCEGNPYGVTRSKDGGRHWQFCVVDRYVTGIAFADAHTGWLVGSAGDPQGLDSAIMKSIDGGATWSQKHFVEKASLAGIAALDSRHAWAVGVKGLILATADGGRTWLRQLSPTAASLRSITFVDRRHGWATGSEGTIIATADGGRHWRLQLNGPIGTDGQRPVLMSVSFRDRRNGWAVGVAVRAPMKPIAVAVHTFDGGLHWRVENPGLSGGLWAVDFVDLTHGWACGGRVVLKYQ